jgi:hypothetical protein
MADATLGEARQLDYDTGGGTDLVEVSGIVFPASGAAVAAGGILETGTNAVGALAVGGGTPHDSVDSGNPLKLGGRGQATVPTSASTDGDRVNAWFLLNGIQNVRLVDSSGTALPGGTQYVEDVAFGGNGTGTLMMARRDDALSTLTPIADDAVGLRVGDKGALWVQISDGSGNQITTFGGGTQYVGDAAATATPTGTAIMGLAHAAAPTDVSADNDAVTMWMLRNGSPVVNIAAGGTLLTNIGQAAGSATFVRINDGTTTAAVIAGTTALKTDESSWGGVAITAAAALADATAIPTVGIVGAALMVANATPTLDRARAANADAQAATGLLGAGNMVWNGATWDRFREASADALTNATGIAASGNVGYNGTTWDRVRTTPALSAAPNVETGVLATGTGPGYDRKRDPAGVAANSTANAVTVVVDGADMVAFQVTTIGTTPGAMIFETTNDDGAWATAGYVIKLSAGPDLRIEGAFVPAVNDVYMVRTTGHRQVRYRVQAVYASGTATVKVTSSSGVGMIKSIDMPAPPHNFGYALVGVSAQYTSAQTSTTIGPTVASTQRMVVTYVQIQAGGTVAATQCSIYFGTGAYSRGTSKAIFDGEFAPSATLKPGFVAAPPAPFLGAADEELKITSVGAANPLTVTIWYYLVAA